MIKLGSIVSQKIFILAATVSGVVVVGTFLLFSTHASTPTTSIETERGSISDSCLNKTDTLASAGGYIQFQNCTNPPPPTPYKVNIWAPVFMGYCPDGSKTCGDTSASQPDKFSMLIGFEKNNATLTRWKASGKKVLFYINGCCSASSDLGPNGDNSTHVYPESSYAHTASGSRITIKAFPTNSLMDPRDPTWQQSLVKKCQHWMNQHPLLDGCFYDTIGIAPLGSGYVTPAVAVDTVTNAPWTDSSYLNAINTEIQLVKQGNPGKLVFGNGLQKGSTYFESTNALYGQLDGAMAELYVKAPALPPNESEVDWKKNVDMLIDAKSRGKEVFVTTKAWEEWAEPPITTTKAHEDSWHKFALATFLLGQSDKSFFSFQYTHSKTSPTEWHPWWDTDLGQPLGTYAKDTSGVYIRRFEKSISVVNPSPSDTITYQLGGSYHAIDSTTPITSVTLTPRTAEIAVK